MTFLPIVVRELRVAARCRGLYRVRFWTALAACACGSYLMLIYKNAASFGGVGRQVFGLLTGLGLFYCAVLARNTADCISEEKREGTLGLLFLTDLKGYDVALGKLFSNSIKSFYGLLATFPVLACAFVLGGVTGLEFWCVVLALLNVFFFSHAAGLLASTLCRDQRRANGAAAVMLIVWFMGIPGLAEWLRFEHFSRTPEWLALFSPVYAFQEASASGARFSHYWTSMLLVQGNAWMFLALASLVMPRCWQDKPGKMNLRTRERFRQWCYGPPRLREARRLRLLGINPYFWLVSRNRLGSITIWAMLGLSGCILVWVLFKAGLRDSLPWFVTFMLLNHTVLKFWIASEACRHLVENRGSGALELLLSCTPLSVDEVIRGQWLALRRLFLGPIVAILCFDLLFVVVAQSRFVSDPGDRDNFVCFVLASMLLLVADSLAIGWVGMWRAMSEKQPRRASGQTISRIMILPFLIYGLLMALGAMGAFNSFGVPLAAWVAVGIAVDVAFALPAQQRLLAEFRTRAAVHPEETLGILGQLGRFLGGMKN